MPASFTLDDTHTLLPGYDRIDIPLDAATDYGSKCARGMHPTRWLTMEAKVPFARSLLHPKEGALDWTGSPRLRETSQSPFFSVSHSLRVVVTLTYDSDGDNDNGKPPPTSYLAFALPLNFVRLRPAVRTSSPHPHPQSQVSSSDALPAAVALPTTRIPPSSQGYYSVPELPAYSQLFYPNGDVRHDDSIPLPLYTPSPDSIST